MAGKVEDLRKCPQCFHYLERLDLAGDEKERVIAIVCLNCGFELSERIERIRSVSRPKTAG